MSRKRARSKAKSQRRINALEAQQHLSSVISDVSMPMIARKNAAKHLVKTSSRNRLPLPAQRRHWICRGCTELLIPGVTAVLGLEMVSALLLASHVGKSAD